MDELDLPHIVCQNWNCACTWVGEAGDPYNGAGDGGSATCHKTSQWSRETMPSYLLTSVGCFFLQNLHQRDGLNRPVVHALSQLIFVHLSLSELSCSISHLCTSWCGFAFSGTLWNRCILPPRPQFSSLHATTQNFQSLDTCSISLTFRIMWNAHHKTTITKHSCSAYYYKFSNAQVCSKKEQFIAVNTFSPQFMEALVHQAVMDRPRWLIERQQRL